MEQDVRAWKDRKRRSEETAMKLRIVVSAPVLVVGLVVCASCDVDRSRASGTAESPSAVPPKGRARLTTRVGRHVKCREYQLSSIDEELARPPHVGTMLMLDERGGCLSSRNLTLVFDPSEKPPTLVAAVYDQWEW
jgi:hypothetical protein